MTTRYLVTIVLTLVGLKLLVWWFEPRIAFYPIEGVQETPAMARLPYQDSVLMICRWNSSRCSRSRWSPA